jgi:hypothetical protein
MNVEVKFENKYNLSTADVVNKPITINGESPVGILTHVQDDFVHGVLWDKLIGTSWAERSGEFNSLNILG